MANVIYYETGAQQKCPLFSYEGLSREEAERVIAEKKGFKKYELVTIDEIGKRQVRLSEWRNGQWFIYPYQELMTGEYL